MILRYLHSPGRLSQSPISYCKLGQQTLWNLILHNNKVIIYFFICLFDIKLFINLTEWQTKGTNNQPNRCTLDQNAINLPWCSQ